MKPSSNGASSGLRTLLNAGGVIRAAPIPDHPYLIAKGVRSHSLRQRGDELLVPLYSGGVLVNLQRIAPDGSKRFLFGGADQGHIFAAGTHHTGQASLRL